MADHAVTDTETDADFADHLRTYHQFLNLFKFGLVGVVTLLIILVVVAQVGRVG